MNWQTRFERGKYKGQKLKIVWEKDKKYYEFMIENNHLWPEIEFVKKEIEEAEKKQIKIEGL